MIPQDGLATPLKNILIKLFECLITPMPSVSLVIDKELGYFLS